MNAAATSSGKTATRNAIGLAVRGVNLTIYPLLALSADQKQKLQALKDRHDNKYITVHNLDEVHGAENNLRLQQELLSLDKETNGAVFIFSSPQKFLDHSDWADTIDKLVQGDLLRFVSIDECHLFSSFGMEFRHECYSLRPILFEKLNNNPNGRHVPIMLMTATPTKQMINDLETLTGLKVNTTNVIWTNDPHKTRRREVGLHLEMKDSSLQKIKKVVDLVCDQDEEVKKFIVYTNSKQRCRHLKKALTEYMSDMDYVGDVIVVHGDLYKEQKFHNTDLFLGDDVTELADIKGDYKELSFHPRGLVATAGAANAGVDDHRVRYVIRDGFPLSIQDLIQEFGR